MATTPNRPDYVAPDKAAIVDAYDAIGRALYAEQWTGDELAARSSDGIKLAREEERLALIPRRQSPAPPPHEPLRRGGGSFTVTDAPSAPPRSKSAPKVVTPTAPPAHRFESDESEVAAFERGQVAWGILRDVLSLGALRCFLLLKDGRTNAYPTHRWNREHAFDELAAGGVKLYVASRFDGIRWLIVSRSDLSEMLSIIAEQKANLLSSKPLVARTIEQSGRKPASDDSAAATWLEFDLRKDSLTFKRGEFASLAREIADLVGLKPNTIEKQIRGIYRDLESKADTR